MPRLLHQREDRKAGKGSIMTNARFWVSGRLRAKHWEERTASLARYCSDSWLDGPGPVSGPIVCFSCTLITLAHLITLL